MKRICLIEDNDDHAFLIGKGLESEDCTVTRFPSGADAVKALDAVSAEEKPISSFLISGWMGWMDSEVLEHLKKSEAFSEVPVVMLTTSTQKKEIAKAYRMGASGFVSKPDDFAELTKKLKKVKEYWFQVVETPVNGAAAQEERSS